MRYTFLLVVLLFLLVPCVADAQSDLLEWEHRSPAVTLSETIRGMQVLGEDVTLVGDDGLVARSTDGGEGWRITYGNGGVALGSWLSGVCFTDRRRGVAVGQGETILRTTDGGLIWDRLPFLGLGAQDLYDVAFADAKVGIITGSLGKLLRTTDGGATWGVIDLGRRTDLHGVAFAGGLNGIVVGDSGSIYRTTDAGLSWSDRRVPIAQGFGDVDMYGSNHAIAVGSEGIIYRTVDGGITWNRHDAGTEFPIGGVSYFNDSTIFAVGMSQPLLENSIILRSVDGGVGWTSRKVPTHAGYLSRVDIDQSGRGFAVGSSAPMFELNDTLEWVKKDMLADSWLHGVAFADGRHGMAVGNRGAVRVSEDGGRSWSISVSGVGGRLMGVGMVDSLFAVAAGDSGIVVRTVDGGRSWQRLTSGLEYHSQTNPYAIQLEDVYMVDRSHGFIVGQGGLILRTEDGGNSWAPTRLSSYVYLRAVRFLDRERGFVAGDSGLVYMTSDGGKNWTRRSTGRANDRLEGIHFFDEQRGWAVGTYVSRTWDGGVTWSRVSTGGSVGGMKTAVAFSDSLHGVISGSDRDRYYTRDGGKNWWYNTSRRYGAYTGVAMTGLEEAIVVGGLGVIMRLGLQPVPAAVPATPVRAPVRAPVGFGNASVFPNPARGAVTVEYTLDHPSSVDISVTDMLGATLASFGPVECDGGVCSVSLETTGLAAGLHLIRLRADNGATAELPVVILR